MNPSALDPAGPGARAIGDLAWLLLSVCSAAYALTTVALAWALARAARNGRRGSDPVATPPREGERLRYRAVRAAVAATVLALCALVGASYATDRRLIGLERGRPAAEIRLTAHQWWWEIRYLDPEPARGFVTANELHLPLGEPVRILLQSADVIHSFWVPNIAGKRDIIPGRDGEIRLTAAEPGEWRGRCSEFCGYQHAHMEILAVVEPRAQYDAWRAAQAAPAARPATEEERQGEQVFGEEACVLCHAIRGSPATGYSATAPDLTHLKSRRTLAAGALPNTKGHLGGWVLDPHGPKPGVLMPPNLLPPARFQALLAYLETLR